MQPHQQRDNQRPDEPLDKLARVLSVGNQLLGVIGGVQHIKMNSDLSDARAAARKNQETVSQSELFRAVSAGADVSKEPGEGRVPVRIEGDKYPDGSPLYETIYVMQGAGKPVSPLTELRAENVRLRNEGQKTINEQRKDNPFEIRELKRINGAMKVIAQDLNSGHIQLTELESAKKEALSRGDTEMVAKLEEQQLAKAKSLLDPLHNTFKTNALTDMQAERLSFLLKPLGQDNLIFRSKKLGADIPAFIKQVEFKKDELLNTIDGNFKQIEGIQAGKSPREAFEDAMKSHPNVTENVRNIMGLNVAGKVSPKASSPAAPVAAPVFDPSKPFQAVK